MIITEMIEENNKIISILYEVCKSITNPKGKVQITYQYKNIMVD